MSDCIFCSIAAGSTPVDVVQENDDTIFFRDISPKAKVHVQGIPKKHVTSFAVADKQTMSRLLTGAQAAAEKLGLVESGFRLIINTGSDSGWEVHHLHVHILGGEPLGPLRCQ
ncbi:histidine triad nucleotide-binding protein [bacterium]|nr:histidine triad nucleotide-binding protein [bacterium]|tara:strand:+ start:412 stop:750 length:339 start_codon:yes stop_codon:yes gene_type:complete